MKKNKGITIISLIITVIIMLVLAGVIVTISIKGELIDKTGEAVEKHNNKAAQIDTETEELVGIYDNVKVGLITEAKAGVVNIAQKPVKYKDPNGIEVTIPVGFTVSGIATEKTVSDGLVIYDIPAADATSINWTADTNSNG